MSNNSTPETNKAGEPFRDVLHQQRSRDALVFLVFLVAVFLYWYLVDIGEEHESRYSFTPVLEHVPDEVVITEPLTATLEVTFKDKGEKILGYRTRKTLQRLTIDYREALPVNGRYVLTGQPLHDLIAEQFSGTAQIISYTPDTLQYYVAPATGKRLPVKVAGVVSADREHVIKALTLVPDSVTVYAPQAVLDTMTAVWTVPVALTQLADSVAQRTVMSLPARGMLCTPAEVDLEVAVSPYVEKELELPVRPYLCPFGQTLKAFPSRAKVSFLISLASYSKVEADDFELVVNYHHLNENLSGKARLELLRQPADVRILSITPEEVEYLMESNEAVDASPAW